MAYPLGRGHDAYRGPSYYPFQGHAGRSLPRGIQGLQRLGDTCVGLEDRRSG